MDIFHSTLWRYKLKADILAACPVLRKTCVAEKTYFRTMECWKYLDTNNVRSIYKIGITVEELEK